MKIAVTYENGEVFQHFGHTEQFKVYDVEEGKVVRSEVRSAQGSGHGALAGLLKGWGVDTLLCGGIGGGARTALASAGIALYGGVQGSADAAVEALLAGKLDGAYIETAVAETYAKQYPDLCVVLDVPYDSEGSAIGVSKGNDSLMAKVNEAIAAALADGSMDNFVAEANDLASGDTASLVDGEIVADEK